MKIAITGVPGTGKTTVAKALAEKLGYKYINLNEILIKNYKIERDEKRGSWVVDVYRASEELKFPENCILDGHLSHFFPVDVVVVLRCRLKELRDRLKKRGWNEEKIRENLEAEALNVIGEEAREINTKVCEVNTTGKSLDDIIEEIIEVIEGKRCDEFDFFDDLEDVL